MSDARDIIDSLDNLVVEVAVVTQSGEESKTQTYKVSPRKNPWRRVAYQIAASLAYDGAPAGSGAVAACGVASARRIVSATARLKDGTHMDALDVLLEERGRHGQVLRRRSTSHPALCARA